MKFSLLPAFTVRSDAPINALIHASGHMLPCSILASREAGTLCSHWQCYLPTCFIPRGWGGGGNRLMAMVYCTSLTATDRAEHVLWHLPPVHTFCWRATRLGFSPPLLHSLSIWTQTLASWVCYKCLLPLFRLLFHDLNGLWLIEVINFRVIQSVCAISCGYCLLCLV